MTGMSQYYCNTSKGCKLQIYMKFQMISRVQNRGKKKPRKKKIIKLPPPLMPSQPLHGEEGKNFLSWVRFRRTSFPDFDKQVYTSTGCLRQDRQETEICARTSVVTDKRKGKNILGRDGRRKTQKITGSRRKTLQLTYASMCHHLLQKRRKQRLERKRLREQKQGMQ